MPTLDVSELNIVISVLGAFIILFGFLSVKIKQVWYLGEALPAVIFGIALGPVAAKFLESEQWASAVKGQTEHITLGMARIVIGIQLVIAGFQLPQKYLWTRWKEIALLLLPVMTCMWLCTTACIMLMIPNLTLLAGLVIGSLMTATDPILSQAIAKGPFADKYVPRPLREIISAEAGANDGFSFPFLLLAVYLIRHADLENVEFLPGAEPEGEGAHRLMARSEEEVGRLGGGTGKAIELWFLEGWLYFILCGVIIGAICGLLSMFAIKFSLRKKWIDSESLLLWPTALGLFVIGIMGAVGMDDLLACFVAGSVMNWNGEFLEETLKRHDEVNSCIDVILNFGGFMYIGTILPWEEFNQPDLTGITPGRLICLGILILLLRRIPAVLVFYKAMPNVVKSWKEALFMGYFGPIGIGAVFYIEHTRELFPTAEEATTEEERNMVRAMSPVIYWMVLFSIVVHGLSIPLLDIIYRWRKIPPIVDEEPVEIRPMSHHDALPNNAYMDPRRGSIVVNNRFSRAPSVATGANISFEDLERRFGQQEKFPGGPPLPPPAPVMPRRQSHESDHSEHSTHALDVEKLQAKLAYEQQEQAPRQPPPPPFESSLTFVEPPREGRRPGVGVGYGGPRSRSMSRSRSGSRV